MTGPAGSVRSGVARLVDGALEASVAGGFGSPGIRLRRRMFGWDELPRMDGRRVLITGATSGIGLAAASEMARLGADLTILGRDPQRTARAAAQIGEAAGRDRPVASIIADMRLMADARRAADEARSDGRAWDVLVHNAGALVDEYDRTPEGFEATYAAQVLSPHIITCRLLPALERGTDPRVIVVSSGGMYAEKLDLATVQSSADSYDGVRAYARAKRAQVTMNEQWAIRMAGSPVGFHCMHPGWADTPGVAESLPTFRRVTRTILRTPQEGADTIVWLAAAPALPAPSGSFWLDRIARRTARLPGTATTPQAADALWDMVCDQTGERPPRRG